MGRPCWSAEEFSEFLNSLNIAIPCRGMDNGPTAVSSVIHNSKQKVLVAGSLFLAGEVLDTFAAPRDILDLA
jgi:dihydrofolate synthase/folylpolyglutamate synthase